MLFVKVPNTIWSNDFIHESLNILRLVIWVKSQNEQQQQQQKSENVQQSI